MSRKRRYRDRGRDRDERDYYEEPAVEKSFKRHTVSAKTEGQRHYIKTILAKDVTICEGLAGTGKTHVAIGVGIWQFFLNRFERIVIARPAVEADESLGFLPGGIKEKMNPYVRPILDELHNFISYSELKELETSHQLEICPVGFMRGRTFKNTFVVCDECQNMTRGQVKMLIARLGMGSKMVLTGDVTQSDLPIGAQGGFQYAYDLYADGLDPDFATVRLGQSDIVRHQAVGRFLEKWDRGLDKSQPAITLTQDAPRTVGADQKDWPKEFSQR